MCMILIQWCYFALTAFPVGFAALFFLERRFGYRVKSQISVLMAGLLILNVYAQYFSLFAGVGIWANVLMCAFALAAAIALRKRIHTFLKQKTEETGRGRLLLYGFLVLLFAYGSSRGYMHYDTGLYHAQSIRWIEEYGVVPGLANLHSRFGYNSAAFALCALFGGAGLTKYPMHCVQGFFALLCAVKCTALLDLAREKRVRLSDFLMAGCVFYLVAVFRELVSPASDYFAMLILFFVAITWAQLLEKKEASPVPYALLSLYLVYAATVKLSAAGMLLLALYPAFLLLRQRKWGQIACYLGLGTVIAFPWLARNVLISGWLFYPFTFLDLFDADWKISKGYADSDAAEIQVYAKEIFDVYQKDMPFGQWFPNWLRAQSVLDRLLVAAGWLAVPVSILTMAAGAGRRAVIWAARKRAGKHGTGTLRKEGGAYRGFVLLEAAALFGFLIWQFGAPLVRYGYFFVLFLPLTAFGGLYVRFFGKGRGFRLFAAFLVAFLLYRGYNLGNMVLELWQEPYYVYQQDYGTWPAETYQVDGVTVYVPLDRGQIGYDKFPSSPVVQSIELRDKKTIESGFRQKAAGTPAGEE